MEEGYAAVLRGGILRDFLEDKNTALIKRVKRLW